MQSKARLETPLKQVKTIKAQLRQYARFQRLKREPLKRIEKSKKQMKPATKRKRLLLAFAGVLISACFNQALSQGENLDNFGDNKGNDKQYLDCQYGQGKWISLMFSPGSSLAVGQINDGAPVFFTSLLSGSRLTLTPRQPGKKLTINLNSMIIHREWYLRDGAGSAGTGECVKGEVADSTFSDDDF